MNQLRIGTRGSRLAIAQAREVAELLRGVRGVRCELVVMSTRGDRQAGPLAQVGGKGLFTAELEDALRDGRLDLAVHSAKDMPADDPRGLCIGAVPARADARDALVSVGGGSPDELRHGAVVGTGSLRRRAQLLDRRPGLNVVAIRGNLDTRLRRVGEGADGLDAVVVAMAGLHRSGLLARFAGRVRPLAVEEMIPAAGQGALAIQCRREDPVLVPLLRRIDDPIASRRLMCERAVLRRLGAGCNSCVAVHVGLARGGWHAWAMVGLDDGRIVRRQVRVTDAADAVTALLDGLSERRITRVSARNR